MVDQQVPLQRPVISRGGAMPDRLYVGIDGLDTRRARQLSAQAVRIARTLSPKITGRAANGIDTYYGNGYFGLRWRHNYLWYQEGGTRPFTMRALAGRTIPMWIDDPTGQMARQNPRAQTRYTVNGRRQVLIFRKAARMGQRKNTIRVMRDGSIRVRNVPASYPGAPGRITSRGPMTFPGQGGTHSTGRIYSPVPRQHVGVRWRHPGIVPREFMQEAIRRVAAAEGEAGLEVHAIYRRR